MTLRYEKLDWQLSTVACAVLLEGLGLIKDRGGPWGYSPNAVANAEIHNVVNELHARLQHHDPDPHAPKNDNTDLTT